MNARKSKHILFLASWYPSRTDNFNGDFIQRHAQAAALHNRITVLYAVNDKSLKSNYEITETKSDITEIIAYYKPSFFRPFNFFKRFIAWQKAFKKIGEIDLVHLNVCYTAGIFALYLKWFKHKKYVISENWTGLHQEHFPKMNFGMRFMIKKILAGAAMYLPVSNHLGKSMQAISPKKAMQVIPNVVDTERFHIQAANTKNSTVKFLHISMLKEEHKNVSGMLNVAKRLADAGFDFEFHIGGNGSLKPITTFIETHQLSKYIKVFGDLKHNEVVEKMANADCFVLFSNYENQPCVQIEAYASGLIFIGTDVGGIAQFLPEELGILIPKADENALYDAMVLVCNGKKFASKEVLHQYAVAHFSKQTIAQKFDEVYNQLVCN